MNILKIKNLTVSIDNKIILKDFNLTIKSGEIHVLMGPNGVGKSTLAKVIMGDSNYTIENGEIYFNDVLINELDVDERSRMGIFLGMQSPLEIEGVTNADFLRNARSIREKNKFKLFDFIKELDDVTEKLKMDKSMIHRGVNQGFSGGERKKNEILQMYMLKPSLVMLDEIDSGLDVDSLRLIGNKVYEYYKEYNPGMIIITHYERLLDYIKPTHVHIVKDGKIEQTGDLSLVQKVEEYGFESINSKKNISIGECVIKEKMDHE